MSSTEDKRGPGLRFPPPLLPIGALGGAWLLQQWAPLAIGNQADLLLPGTFVVGIALVLAVIALLHFWRAHIHVEPWQPTTAIIHSGIFRFSRNPIYLAFCIATLGGALIINSWWGILAILPLLALLQTLVIRKEEAYLEAKFGQTYLDYKNSVRCWL